MIQIFGTGKCKGTKAAQRFFSDRSLKFQFVDLKAKALSKGELQSVARAVGGIRALYDASKDPTVRYAAPTDTQLELLLVDNPGWLVTPIVRRSPAAAVGLAEDRWRDLAEAEKAGA
jgi:arsenate reductase